MDAYLAVCRDILNNYQVISSDTYHSKSRLLSSIVHLGHNFHQPGVKITSAPSKFAFKVHLFIIISEIKSRSSFLSVYSLLTAESLMNACSGNLWILTLIAVHAVCRSTFFYLVIDNSKNSWNFVFIRFSVD